MSSMEISPDLQEKRSRFLRTGSLQRLKCTATQHFQLAGSTFSKTSIAQIFEWVISISRAMFQNTLIMLTLPVLKCICGCTLWIIDMLTMMLGINLLIEKTALNLNEKSLRFLSKIQHIQMIKLNKIARLIPNAMAKTVAKSIESSENLELNKTISVHEDTSSVTTDEPVIETKMDAKAETESSSPLHTATTSTCCNSSAISPSMILSAKEQLLKKKSTEKSIKPTALLIVCVYGSASFVYLQFMLLVVGLQSTYAPPGLVFLVFSLAYIGYIIYRVLSGNKFVSTKSKTNMQQTTATNRTAATATAETGRRIGGRFRFGRIASRKFLDFHNKTLSKIQLL